MLLLTHCFMQTLTTMDLGGNSIGVKGAQHFANALQQNQVTSSTSHRIIHSLFHTDTHHTLPD